MRRGGIALLAAAALASGCNSTDPLVLETRLTPEAVPVFYGGGRKHGALVTIPPDDWAELVDLFEPPAGTSHEERVAIAAAVAMLERVAGGQTPAAEDKAKNEKNPDWYGHQDCVDESTNTTLYLKLLEQEGLLHHHIVLDRLRRTVWTAHMHWTAQIRDETDGTRYVVDSWFRDNGEPPYVQEAEAWLRSDPLPDVIE